MKYYVNAAAKRSGDGSADYPFQTIQAAADLAVAGDEILVAPGIYREYVNPKNPGTPEARITYRLTEPLAAVITGAEPVKNWQPADDMPGVWTARVPNSLFGAVNPYTELVSGDWFIASFIAHTGDVYLGHKSLYEVTSLDEVRNPQRSAASWDPDFSVYTWYAEQDAEKDETVFYANFQGLDPNKEDVEISVRKDCFLPEKEGIGYITLSGFTVREAATQWAPPTAYQDGMIGPHWSKGWIIEDCEIYESKCSGISLGKYLQPNNDNKWLRWKFKDGTQTERDCICQASYEGWDKEHVGSHIVRRCHIHDCGQTGIVGHLGGVFSLIEDNHIHHINVKKNLAGAEIGGIKMHAAIDVMIRRNHFHHCTRGLWLDWQAQGTRVTQNLFHDNCLPIRLAGLDRDKIAAAARGMGEDIFVEVSHGPTLIDNNLLLSDRSIKLCAQGVSVVHNLVAGSFAAVGIGTDNGSGEKASPRYTPYHQPHGTRVAGFMTFLHGDDRIYNNVFIRKTDLDPVKKAFGAMASQHPNSWDDMNFNVGTYVFNGYPSHEKWASMFEGYCGMGAETEYPDRYYDHLPVWIEGNVYCNGAKPADCEKNAVLIRPELEEPEMDLEALMAGKIPAGEESSLGGQPEGITISLEEKDGGWYLRTNLYDYLGDAACRMISTETLGMAFEPEQKFENPDGSPILFKYDYFGNERTAAPIAGPFADAAASLRKL